MSERESNQRDEEQTEPEETMEDLGVPAAEADAVKGGEGITIVHEGFETE